MTNEKQDVPRQRLQDAWKRVVRDIRKEEEGLACVDIDAMRTDRNVHDVFTSYISSQIQICNDVTIDRVEICKMSDAELDVELRSRFDLATLTMKVHATEADGTAILTKHLLGLPTMAEIEREENDVDSRA